MPDAYSNAAGQQLAVALAARTGTQAPPNAWQAFAAQVANETGGGDPSTRGVRNNNPFNVTTAGGSITWPGQVGSDGPFAVFYSVSDGVNAAAQNYTAPAYQSVVSAFQFGDPFAIAKAIEASPWAVGGYGGSLSASLSQGASAVSSSVGGPSLPSASAGSPAASGTVPSVGSRIAGLFPQITIPFGVGPKSLLTPAKVLVTIGVVGVLFFGAVQLAGGPGPGTVAKDVAAVEKG